MKVGGSGSTWSPLFRFVPCSRSYLIFSFLVEDSLLVLIIVEHLNIDSEGIIEVIVVSRSSVEEVGEHSDDLGEDIRLRRVDARAVSLDNSVALERDLSLGSIGRSRRSRRATGASVTSSGGGLLSQASSGRRVVGGLSGCIGTSGHSQIDN